MGKTAAFPQKTTYRRERIIQMVSIGRTQSKMPGGRRSENGDSYRRSLLDNELKKLFGDRKYFHTKIIYVRQKLLEKYEYLQKISNNR
ncbi:MAG: hypothetical protein AB4372_17705 [Xenococcus sp. (in: cyanobacteria)]